MSGEIGRGAADGLDAGLRQADRVWTATLAGAEARVASVDGGVEEANAIRPRPPARAAGPAVDAGRRHAVDERAVGGGVPRRQRFPAEIKARSSLPVDVASWAHGTPVPGGGAIRGLRSEWSGQSGHGRCSNEFVRVERVPEPECQGSTSICSTSFAHGIPVLVDDASEPPLEPCCSCGSQRSCPYRCQRFSPVRQSRFEVIARLLACPHHLRPTGPRPFTLASTTRTQRSSSSGRSSIQASTSRQAFEAARCWQRYGHDRFRLETMRDVKAIAFGTIIEQPCSTPASVASVERIPVHRIAVHTPARS